MQGDRASLWAALPQHPAELGLLGGHRPRSLAAAALRRVTVTAGRPGLEQAGGRGAAGPMAAAAKAVEEPKMQAVTFAVLVITYLG